MPVRKASGLAEAVKVLEGVEGSEIVRLGTEDVVRHPLVQRIVEAYRSGREKEAERQKPKGETRAGDDGGSGQ